MPGSAPTWVFSPSGGGCEDRQREERSPAGAAAAPDRKRAKRNPASVQAGVRYVYAVRAVDKAGNASPPSNRVDETAR